MTELYLKSTKVFRDCEEAYKNKYPVMIEEGGSRCFIGNTLIQTEKGYIPIKDIQKGTRVLSFNQNSKKLVYNKVTKKFIYRWEHPLIRLKTKNGTITSTYDHKFLTQGHWTEAYKLAERSLEKNPKHRQIFLKQLWKIKDYKLEKYRQRETNASSYNEEKPQKIKRFLPKNNDKKGKQIRDNSNAQGNSKTFYSKSTKQARGKSQERKNKRQPDREFRMGNSLRELYSFLQDRITKTQNKRVKRNEQTNRTKSKRNNKKIYTLQNNSKNVSQRIQCLSMHNQDNIRTKQEKMRMARDSKEHKTSLQARELNEEDIISAKLFIKKIPVYDIEVEKTKSYCITKNNYIVHNSGKTVNILIWIIQKCLTEWKDKIIDIGRKTFPSLRTSVMFDFFNILKTYDLYSYKSHDKSDHIFRIRGNIIRFFSLDQEQKIRGASRDILFMNEANEFNEDDFKQLNQRTREITIIDYNPSTEFGWFYDIQEQDQVKVYHSTYKDNPYLPERVKKTIEAYKETDENYWRVFGLGLRGVSKTTIFSNWDLLDEFKGDGETYFGMDFGFNHPTTLVRVKYDGKNIIIDELLYKSELTSDMMINELNKLKEEGLISVNSQIIGDSSRPEVIQDIYKAGYNIKPTRKGKDSVMRNINFFKKHKIKITKSSTNLIKEIKSYKWKTDKQGRVLDEQVKINDDCLDAGFYSLEDKSTETDFAVGKVNWD